ncbi:MAG: hypothetical protein AAGE96_11640 [Cyanobacteria bacterium P01_G01_bin.19]
MGKKNAIAQAASTLAAITVAYEIELVARTTVLEQKAQALGFELVPK